MFLSTRSTFRRLSINEFKEEETANYLFPLKWFVLLFDAQDINDELNGLDAVGLETSDLLRHRAVKWGNIRNVTKSSFLYQ